MSSIARPERRGATIAWPIFALVLASVIVATVVFVVVTFNGPPPMARPYPMPVIAEALATGRMPADVDFGPAPRFGPPPFDGGGHPPSDDPGGRIAPRTLPPSPGMAPRSDQEPALVLYTASAPPAPRSGERIDQQRAARIAALLHVPNASVFAATDEDQFGPDDFVFSHFTFALRQGDAWRIVRSPPQPLLTRWRLETMAAMLLAIVLLAIPAFALARAISRPLGRLAEAAEQARVGAALPPLPEGGSREVRDLSRAVRSMHARLAGYAEGRTTMLAAIAHDLGTPLSRIAFWIEHLPEPAHARASADIDEMRAMIAATLAFARDEAGQAAATRLDLGALLDSLVEDMATAGSAVTIDPGPRAIVRGDSVALRRLFSNLLVNAVRYGDRAEIGWRVEDNAVTVHVDDAGPGIDPALAERLFEPFVRGDPSRNRSTGGAGLGLAIVRSIADRHGGEAGLETRPGRGGARAWVTLPLSR